MADGDFARQHFAVTPLGRNESVARHSDGRNCDGELQYCISPVRRELKFAEVECPLRLPPLVLRQDLLQVHWIGEDWDLVVVAGGHVLNCILGDAEAIANGDVDVFFCGPEPKMPDGWCGSSRSWRDEWMTDAIVRLYSKSLHVYGRKPTVTFEGGSIAFTLENALYRNSSSFVRDLTLRIQIVLQPPCANPHELISRFDATNCQFAYRNGTVFATNEAMEYLRTGVVRVQRPWTGSGPISRAEERRQALVAKYAGRNYNSVQQVAEHRSANQHPAIEWYDAPLNGLPEKYARHAVKSTSAETGHPLVGVAEPIVLDDVRDVADFVALLAF